MISYQKFVLSPLRLALFVAVASLLASPVNYVIAQEDAAPEPLITEAALPSAADEALQAEDLVQINWVEKLRQGGVTMAILVLLSISGLAFAGERLLALRARYVAPEGLADEALQLLLADDTEAALAACDAQPSTLASIIRFIVEHRDNPVETINTATGDIGGRDIRNMLARSAPLAVIASLSPLLGLLGTMIGMIEAFELVSIYGDDGGASMLAGSIAKALITTAAGLIIAIPTLAAYQFFKHRINHLTQLLEEDTERIISHLYLKNTDRIPVLTTEDTDELND